MKQIGWAVVGTGVIARKFIAALAQAKDARLVCVMSRKSESAVAFAAAAGDVRAVTDLADVLGDSQVDIVYIATPNHLHAAQSLACLRAKKSVLCEKPLATNSADARTIAAAAQESGCFCMEALSTMCLPAIARAQELIGEGRIGTVREVSGSLSFPRVYDPDSRFFSTDLGGGVLLDLGVYPLSLALHFLGAANKMQAVSSQIRVAPNGVDMHAALVTQHEGALAHVSCGFYGEGSNDMVICGEAGILRLQAPLNAPALVSITSQFEHRDAGGHGLPQIDKITPDSATSLAAIKQILRPLKPGRTKYYPTPYRGNGFIHQIEEAMNCVRAGQSQSQKVPLSLSIAVLEVIDAAKAQAES